MLGPAQFYPNTSVINQLHTYKNRLLKHSNTITRDDKLTSYKVKDFNLMQMTGYSKTPGKLESKVEAEILRLVSKINS